MASYGTNEGLTAYMLATGRVMPVGANLDVARHFGTMYVDQFWVKYKGSALTSDNAFPRNLYNPTPANVEYASYEAAFSHASEVDIFGGGGSLGGQVIEEAVDVLRVKYAAPQEGTGYWENNLFILPLAYAYLIPYFKTKGGAGAAFVVGGHRSKCGC